MTLTGTDDLGNEVLLETGTDPDGTYEFTSLRPGTYEVTETQPSPYLDAPDTPAIQIVSIELAPGEDATAPPTRSSTTYPGSHSANGSPSSSRSGPVPVDSTAVYDTIALATTGDAPGDTLGCMPTTRRRYPITETDDIAAILDEAARKWPDVPRQRLIQRVIADWASGGRSPSARTRARADLVGSLPGSADLYDRVEDWPE